MKIGITYDLKNDYPKIDNRSFHDFSTAYSISFLKKQFELAGYEVDLIGTIDKLKQRVINNTLDIDLIYNTSEGVVSRNRECLVPALLETFNIPFIGSDAYALAISLNKYHTKILAESIGIPTAKSVLIEIYDSNNTIKEKLSLLSYPIVVKPNHEGSSMGIYIVNSEFECLGAIDENKNTYNQEVICEEFTGSAEITVPVIGTGISARAMGVIRFCHENGDEISFFTTEDKLFKNTKCEEAQLPRIIKEKIILYAESMHRFIGCREISRTDFRISPNGKIDFLEINPIPALDPEGSFVCGANCIGLSFSQMLHSLVEMALKRYSLTKLCLL